MQDKIEKIKPFEDMFSDKSRKMSMGHHCLVFGGKYFNMTQNETT